MITKILVIEPELSFAKKLVRDYQNFGHRSWTFIHQFFGDHLPKFWSSILNFHLPKNWSEITKILVFHLPATLVIEHFTKILVIIDQNFSLSFANFLVNGLYISCVSSVHNGNYKFIGIRLGTLQWPQKPKRYVSKIFDRKSSNKLQYKMV